MDLINVRNIKSVSDAAVRVGSEIIRIVWRSRARWLTQISGDFLETRKLSDVVVRLCFNLMSSSLEVRF